MMDTEIQPLPKSIADKAKELGVTEIHLDFSGGGDEGHLDVSLNYDGKKQSDEHWGPCTEDRELVRKIEDWAWHVYSYNGAGDGADYGDNLIYNLSRGIVEVSEWYYRREDSTLPCEQLVIKEDENETPKD